jgi:hypothetical membrane protein
MDCHQESVMTTTNIRQDRTVPDAQPGGRRSRVRQLLLLCGILSSLLYVGTDLLGGTRYEGYSFSSQAVSELMAVGAPSETLVDPLFIIYGILVIGFGIGVFREGSGRTGTLQGTGALLIGYAVLGLAGPTRFEMQQRGAGNPESAFPHIALTGALVLFLLLAIGFGAFALGKRFSRYSFATLLTIVVFSILAAPFGARLATGQPTPGFGILERISIYAFLAWVAVLAIALFRWPWSAPQAPIG